MKSTVFNMMAGLGLVGALALPAPAAARDFAQGTAATQQSDDEIETRIENILKKDSMLAARDIDVESDHGRVTLTGEVKTAAEKTRAATLAKVSGVSSVVNEIEVNPNADRPKSERAAEATKEGLNKAVDATAKGASKATEATKDGAAAAAKGVGKAAEKTADALDKTGDKLSGTAISTKVKANIDKDAALKNTSIKVTNEAGVITLRGTVPSAAIKARAEEVATRTEGVTRVVNELVVSDVK